MKLENMLKAVNAQQIIGTTNLEVNGIHMDSRMVKNGFMFVAVKGTQADGHNYISKAIENGATVIVCEQLPVQIESNVTYVQLTDTEEAVGKLATTFYGDPTSKLELVGVTGTNGKTTIATLLYNMFRLFGYKAGLISTVCNYIDGEAIPTDHTTPDPITLNQLLGRMADEGCKYVFMEVSSHSVVQKRISGLTFAGGIFTNITRDHLDYHKTFENYLKAKKAFFDNLPKQAFALSILFCIFISALVFIFAGQLMGIFVSKAETEVIACGIKYLRVEGAFYWGIGCLFLFYGYYRAVKRAGMSVVLTVISLGMRVLLAYVLSAKVGEVGIWAAIPIGWVLADITGLVCMLRSKL